jgi:3-hydroxyisobutyrate dehydrogenase
MHLGVVGVGKMGAAIAARLMDVGHQVTVWNRTSAKTKALVETGATVAATPADLASAVEVVLTVLTDGAAVDQVYCGPSGLLSGAVTGKLFIEMSTVAPMVEIDLATKVRAKGAALVECPVGGSTPPARQGKLLGLMGADAADAERATPILSQICRRLEHCGPVGSGTAMKLAVNLPLLVAWQAYGEALAICQDVGWDSKRLVDLFVDTGGANAALKNRADMIVAMLEGRDPGPTTFTVADGCKDLRTMLRAGLAKGIDMPVVRTALQAFDEANRNGFAAGDSACMSVYWANRKKS